VASAAVYATNYIAKKLAVENEEKRVLASEEIIINAIEKTTEDTKKITVVPGYPNLAAQKRAELRDELQAATEDEAEAKAQRDAERRTQAEDWQSE
jgi:hypothetical protein